MEGPNQELEDVANAFANINFQDGLKLSLRNKGYQLFDRVMKEADMLRLKLVEVEAGFKQIRSKQLCNVLLDHSLMNRGEFQLDCNSNQQLAYVGDAYLSLYLAKKCFKEKKTPGSYSSMRQRYCCNKRLALIHDQLLHPVLPICWDGVIPGVKQKSECLEALIGMLYEVGHQDLADFICKRVMMAQ